MTTPDPTPAAAAMIRELRLQGPTLATTLRERLGLSPATFTRVIASVRAELVSSGATRSLTYGLRRVIVGLPPSLPVYEIGPTAVTLFATLHPVAPRGFLVESVHPIAGFHPDLPWFLYDMRPAGFLGRLGPRQHPELALSPEIQTWSADDVLRYLHAWGLDTVGSLVVGDPAFARAQQHPSPEVPAEGREQRYPQLAAEVMGLGVPGSSAAGEQPKFLCGVRRGAELTPVLVKFSPPVADATTRRIADLLRCEHHALQTLSSFDVPAANSALVEGHGQVFLEVERFDRQGGGRLGLVSLLALAAHHGAAIADWTTAADDLLATRVITAEDHRRMIWLDRFGALIANTDRHAGNLSFFFAHGRPEGVAPVYDMLPMAYTIRGGQVFTPPLVPPVPTPRLPEVWREVWAAAIVFWRRVADDAALDPSLRDVAEINLRALASRQDLLNRLPGTLQPPLFSPRA